MSERILLCVMFVLVVLSWPVTAPAQTVALSGTVLRDSLQAPVPGAHVLLPQLRREVITDARGQFRIGDLPVGTFEIVVRAVGFSPMRDSVTLVADRAVMRSFVLSPAVARLDSVEVIGTAPAYVSPRLRGFEERRTIYRGGRFIPEERLRESENLRLSTVVRQHVPGLQVIDTRNGAALASSRGRGFDPRPCYVDVYLDGMPFQRLGRDPIDIDRFGVNQLAGVEYYPGGASVPAEFNRTASGCGVLLLWTRER